MLRYLEFPLEKNCLSTLRYDLARYESADVAATFAASAFEEEFILRKGKKVFLKITKA